MKKNGFILTAIGLIFLLINYEVRFTLSQETTLVVDVVPDLIGFVLIFLGLKYIGKYTVNMRAGIFASFGGIIVSFVQTALKQAYGTLTGFRIVFEIIYCLVFIVLIFSFTYGLSLLSARVAKSIAGGSNDVYAGRDAAESDFRHMSALFSVFGRLYCIAAIASCAVNVILILFSSGATLTGIGLVFATLTIIAGIIKTVLLIALIVVTLRASAIYGKVTIAQR